VLAEESTPADVRGLVERGFDLVHGHGGTRILHAAPWLRRRVPMVISLYGYDCSRLLRDPCWVERYRWAAEQGAVFVVLHRSMRESLLERGIPESSVREIPLGIRLEDWTFHPATARESAPPRFVFVGRLMPKKAPTQLIRALARLRRAFGIEAALDMIGDGPLEDEVNALVHELDLVRCVRLHGRQPRTGIIRILRGATALVLPSTEAADGDREGTPIVLMEAQAIGVPCITTQHSGNADVLPPVMRSFVVNRAEPQSLAEMMASLARISADERQSLRDAGRAWIEAHHDIARTAAAYDALYDELLAAVESVSSS
jgi:glycosyltransferase involved in cell wall biosynthesis